MALRCLDLTAKLMLAAARVPARAFPTAAAASLSLTILALPGAAQAQSVGSRIDQPTPGTLPAGTHNADTSTAPANQPTGRVAPPSAISSSTDVMKGGPVQGAGAVGGSIRSSICRRT